MNEHAEQVYRYAASAMDDCENKQDAADVLIDAVAVIISERGCTVEDAVARLRESAATFADADIIASHGGVMN